jgi:hypothetical protein
MNKKMIDAKLLLPKGVSLEVFMELVNNALEQSDYDYDICSWDSYKNEPISNEINSCWYRLVPVSSEKNELILEFDRNWKEDE